MVTVISSALKVPGSEGGYTIRVNDDRWRAVLERVTAAADGRSRVTVRIKGRYGEDEVAGS
jgi:hypothetical protein